MSAAEKCSEEMPLWLSLPLAFFVIAAAICLLLLAYGIWKELCR